MGQDLVETVETVEMQGDGVIGVIARAEIDTLIATARRYPRSLSRVQARMLGLAQMDEISAEECVYSVPRSGKTIEGPSIRFAEMAAQAFCNARIAARTTLIDRTEKFVEAEGVFLDAETNVATLARVRRRISQSNGRLFSDDMILVTCNAAQSIARRNAILAGIPKSVWRKPYEAARSVIMGDITTLANRRAEAITAFQRFGLGEAQVLGLMHVKGVEDIDQEKLVPLRGMYASLKNGDITVEELLRSLEPAKKPRVTAETADMTAPSIVSDASTPSANMPTTLQAGPPASDTTKDAGGPESPGLFDQTNTKADCPEPAGDDIPNDLDVIASDIITRINAAAGKSAALNVIVDETQDEFSQLGPERQDKVRRALDAARGSKPKKAA